MALPYPSKTFTSGQVPTTAQWNELNANDQALAAGTGLNQGSVPAAALATSAITLGYASRTSDFTTSSTSAVQVTSLSAPVTIPAGGRKVKITVFAEGFNAAGGGATVTASIWDGTVGSGTQLAAAVTNPAAVANIFPPLVIMAVVTPSAGSKTYNVGLLTSNAGAAATIQAGASAPAFILVEAA